MEDMISRKKAIEEIKAVFEWHDTVTMERMIEHFNNLPSAQPDSKELSFTHKALDTISRQAAIRWVKTECNPYGKPTLDFESGKKVIEHLKQMPSAQPETHEERTETHACDCINRKDAIDAHYEYCNKHPDAGFPVWSLKILEDLPPAQPTLYGYSIDHLALIADVMAKEGVSPEEAVQFFKDTQRIYQMLVDEIQKQIEGMFESCVT